MVEQKTMEDQGMMLTISTVGIQNETDLTRGLAEHGKSPKGTMTKSRTVEPPSARGLDDDDGVDCD